MPGVPLQAAALAELGGTEQNEVSLIAPKATCQLTACPGADLKAPLADR